MNKNSGLAIVAVSTFQGKDAQPDVNGFNSIYLTPVAGVIPNRNVLAGTVAKNSGFEEGKSYLAKFVRLEDDPTYGAQFGWTKVSEVTNPMDIIKAEQELGAGNIYDVDRVSTRVETTQEQEG